MKKEKKDNDVLDIIEPNKKSKKKADTAKPISKGNVKPLTDNKLHSNKDVSDEITPIGKKSVENSLKIEKPILNDRVNFVKEENSDNESASLKSAGKVPEMDGAVLKPVAGGLQPIIQPKGKVQLTPIVVPVAIVPYATQNQPMLQYDKKGKADTKAGVKPTENVISDQPLDKAIAPEARRSKKEPKIVAEKQPKAKKNQNVGGSNASRIKTCAILTLVLNILFLVPVVLAKLMPNLSIVGAGTLGLLNIPNVIDGWMNFNATDFKSQLPLIVFTIPCILAIVNIVFAIISLINKKHFKFWISGLIMTVVILAGILVFGLGIIQGDMTVGVLPFGANSGAYRLFAIALIFMIISLMYRYNSKMADKGNVENSDDFSTDELVAI